MHEFYNKIKTLLAGKIFKNIAWFTGDKVVKLALSAVVGSLVARYLGPEDYGVMNYMFAYISLFGVIASFGLNPLVVRDLAKSPDKTQEIMGTAFTLKLIGGVLAILIGLIVGYFSKLLTPLYSLYFVVASLSYLFTAFEVFDSFFQTKMLSKTIVTQRMIGFVFSSVVRVIGVFLHFNLLFFVGVFALDFVVGSFFLARMGRLSGVSLWKFTIDKKLVWQYTKEAMPIILTGTLIGIYMRVDKVLMLSLSTKYELGIYSAATKLSELWFFIPSAIGTVMAPVLSASKYNPVLYLNRVRKQLTLITYTTLAICIGTSIASPLIVSILYGKEFMAAAPILAVHIWSLVFVSLGIAQQSWNVIENLQHLWLWRTIAGTLLSIVLYILLIPKYGAMGAAIATTVSYALPNFIGNYFHPKTRDMFWLQLDSLIPSVRNVKLIIQNSLKETP